MQASPKDLELANGVFYGFLALTGQTDLIRCASQDTQSIGEPMTKTSPAGEPDQGNWNRRVWRLAGPIILSSMSTPLLGAVDTAVVGRLGDASYIGGVSVGAMIFSFLLWGFGFLRMATTGFTAQAFGAGDEAEIHASFYRPLGLALALGFLLVVLQAPIAFVAFGAVGAGPEVELQARLYFGARIWSSPAALVNYAILGWLLGTQQAKAALFFQILLNGLNILLDFWFVVGLGWGVQGVAFATVIAEITAAGLGLLYVWRYLSGRAVPIRWRQLWTGPETLALFRVNFDIFIRTLCVIFAFSYFTILSARLGDDILAANAILMHFLSVTSYALDGFANAAEILAGNAVGARSLTTFRHAVKVSSLWALATAVLLVALFWLLGSWLITLFTDLPTVISLAEHYLPWLIALPIFAIWGFQLDGIFIGATRAAALRNAMVLSALVFFVATWILLPLWGNNGLWLAITIFLVARALTLGFCYPALERAIARTGQ
ncbi:MAG: MATE family efflux transporter [Pseudomonadota bacterium]